MCTTLFHPQSPTGLVASAASSSPAQSLDLTPREKEICILHFIDGRSQPLIADWLGIYERSVRRCINRALKKYPALANLNHKSRRPKIVHMSQIQNPRDLEHAPFNPDEL
jgi:DNA-binding NarL/FixJ family response regulator